MNFAVVAAIALLEIGQSLVAVAHAAGTSVLLRSGTYEVTYRLEVPHVEEWAVDDKVRICIRNAGHTALPVLSANNPLSKCPASNIRQTGETLSFDINCHEREGARAKAVFQLKADAFQGRIAMTMGGKNMTFVEVQSGHRVGSCMLAGDPVN